MKFVNIYDAKTNLSKYLEKVTKNHEVIVICRNGVPVGQITEYKPQNAIKMGLLKGKLTISEDFDAELPDDIMRDYQ